MRKLFSLLFFLGCLNTFGQNLYLKAEGASESQTRIIDSLGYIQKHANYSALTTELEALGNRLSKTGYLENRQTASLRLNDSTFLFRFETGSKTRLIHIYIGKAKKITGMAFPEAINDTLTLSLPESENYLTGLVHSLEQKGYAMAKARLRNLVNHNGQIQAELELELEQKRSINAIVVNGYEKFPPGFRKNIFRMYRNKTFSQQTLEQINKEFSQYRFVKQIKYPEILFLKDSTKVYVYLEKAKANSFDGFLGFSNDENGKIIFNGYLDLMLNNILNSGEKLALYWKSDGKQQKTFNLALELPYLFKSPFALKAQLNIFRQDSLFQNTRTNLDLGYYLRYNNRLYLGYQSAESSDIQNTNSALLNDFSNYFFTGGYEFFNTTAANQGLFRYPDETTVNFKAGTGSRSSKFERNPQFFTSLNLNHNFYLNHRNTINLKSQNYYLQSSNYIINELYRFGGITSIRGFNENSLQGNVFTSLLTEYRYALSPGLYLHSIVDYGYFQDRATNASGNLLGLGFGFGLLTKNGLLKLVYANGSAGSQTVKLSNSIVHISFRANF